MLEIRLFGAPTILYKGQPWVIQRRIIRSLLYFLAANRQPVGRARLATFFWPDLDDGKSRDRLRDYLGKLRSALPDPTLLQTSTQSVTLDFERVSVDYLKFQALQGNIGRVTWTLSPSATMPITVYNNMVAMAELRNGPGFISGVDMFVSDEIDDWLTITRQRLDNEYMTIIQHLFHHEQVTGNLQGAIHWLHKALLVDPLNVEVNLLLVNTLLENGQQAEAQKQFTYFQREMGQDFDPQLSAEFEELKKSLYAELQEISAQEGHPWPLRSALNAPYVGQEKTLTQIETLYKRGGAVIVYGEAGAGKTRLAKEIHDRIQPHPRLFLASCHLEQAEVPFYPWIELLRIHVTREEWLHLPPDWANTLAVILPELASLREDVEAVPDPSSARTRQDLFDVLYQVLQVLSKGNPVMLFLDDVHWADESSCDFLYYLLNHAFFRNPNRILLMTARKEEPNPGIMKFLHTIPGRVLEQAYLARLTEMQVSELARFVFGETPSQEFIEKVTRNSGGNPYFVLETFQAILDSPEKYSLQDPTSLPLSSSVHQLIKERLARLPTDANKVLQIAAILGNHFDVDILEDANTFSSGRFISAMEALDEAGLLARIEESKKLRYAFVHENIRECLLQDMPALRSKQLHNKVAHALEKTAHGQTDEIAITLAQHYEKAEEFTRAFIYWIRGADYAYWLTSTQEALHAFDRARSLIYVMDNLADDQLYELYTKWTDAIIYLDDPLEVEKLSQELLEIGRERKSDLLIGAALDGFSDACFAKNQFERSLEYVLEAAPYAQRSGNLYEILTVWAHQGASLYMLGKFQEARPILQEVLDRVPAEQDARFRNLYCNLHYQIGIVETLMGYPTRGLDFFKRALEHRHKAPAPLEVMSIYTAMGLAYFLTGEFKAGHAVCATAIEMGEQFKYYRMLGYAYAYSALNGLCLGLIDDAWQHADEALRIGQTYGHPEISALAYRNMGSTYLRLEDYPSAIECYQRGLQVAGEHFVGLELRMLLGFAIAAVGKVEEGLEYLTTAYQLSSQSMLGSISVYAQSLLLFIQCKQGNVDSNLLQDIELALVNAKRRSINRAIVVLKTPITGVSRRPADIARQLNESVQDASRMSDPIFEAGILLELIKFKKKQNLPWQAEANRLETILKELAPRAENLPFESAWQRYFETMMSLLEYPE